MKTETVIHVDKLTKRYGELVAVNAVSFSVHKGEIFGLLGENGAGKTTTLEILEGLKKPTSGTATVFGYDVQKDISHIKQRIGVQLQSSAYYSYLTLREILELFGSFYNKRTDAMALLELVDLVDKAKSYVTELSGGQKQRFSIVASLVNDPELVFLDEPTTGLDPLARRNLWELITTIKKQGKTIVLTTHYLEEAELLCDRVTIMEKGTVVASDTTPNLVEHAECPYVIIFETATAPSKEVTKKLEDVGTFHHRAQQERQWEVRLSNRAFLNQALDAVRSTEPLHLVVRPASLEDVFIQLTGKTIAE